MTNYTTIKYEKSGKVARIFLNRPDAANGLNEATAHELASVAAVCDSDPTVKVVGS